LTVFGEQIRDNNDVLHEQQVPVLRARSLHTSDPLHILQMGFEAHLDVERDAAWAEEQPKFGWRPLIAQIGQDAAPLYPSLVL
jgi:hypothetical protein